METDTIPDPYTQDLDLKTSYQIKLYSKEIKQLE